MAFNVTISLENDASIIKCVVEVTRTVDELQRTMDKAWMEMIKDLSTCYNGYVITDKNIKLG